MVLETYHGNTLVFDKYSTIFCVCVCGGGEGGGFKTIVTIVFLLTFKANTMFFFCFCSFSCFDTYYGIQDSTMVLLW